MKKNNKILEFFILLSNIKPKNKKEIKYSKNKQNLIYFRCTKCKHIITLEKEIEEDIILNCPVCGTKGIIRPIKKVDTKTLQQYELFKYKKLIEIEKGLYKSILQVKFIGILLIIIGMIFLGITTIFNIKLVSTLILIGVLILVLLPNKKYFFTEVKKYNNKRNNKNIPSIDNNLYFNKKLNYLIKQFDISEKISLVIIILIIFLYIITGVNDLEIFLIFVYLGLLIIKELTSEFIPNYFKKRINIFIIGFFVIFAIIIIKKIISIVSI